MEKVLFIQNVCFELLGVMTLSAVLKKEGFITDVLLESDIQRITSYIVQSQPDLIAFSSTTGQHKWVIKVSEAIKAKIGRIPIIAGGPHPTYFPEMIGEPAIDIICRGEGEEAVVALMKDIKNVRIANLWFKREGRVIKNDLRPLIQNLDSLPFPDRGLYDKHHIIKTSPVRRFITTRGCPFNCSYCYNGNLKQLYRGKGRYVRRRSIQNVIDEIKDVHDRYRMKYIRFEDDIFAMDENWLLPFLEIYREKISIPFICYIKPEYLNKRIAQALSTSKCKLVTFSPETGNEALRHSVLQKKVSNEQIIVTVEILKKYHIPFLIGQMFGIPDESLENAFETVEFTQQLKPNDVWCSVFQPYPKTKACLYALEKKYLGEEDLKNIPDNYHTYSILKQKDINKIVNLQKFFYLAIYLPFLWPIIKKLVNLPPNCIFQFIHNLCYLFSYAKRTGSFLRAFREFIFMIKYA